MIISNINRKYCLINVTSSSRSWRWRGTARDGGRSGNRQGGREIGRVREDGQELGQAAYGI